MTLIKNFKNILLLFYKKRNLELFLDFFYYTFDLGENTSVSLELFIWIWLAWLFFSLDTNLHDLVSNKINQRLNGLKFDD